MTTWTCPDCRRHNSTVFCKVCGAPAPAQPTADPALPGAAAPHPPPHLHDPVDPGHLPGYTERPADTADTPEPYAGWPDRRPSETGGPAWPQEQMSRADTWSSVDAPNAPLPGGRPPGAADTVPISDLFHPGPPPGRPRAMLLVAAVAVGVLVVLAAGIYLFVSNHQGSHPTAEGPPATAPSQAVVEPPVPPDTTSPVASPTPSAPASSPPVGTVGIAPEVTDSQAPAVAALFQTYFDGVNNRDYQAAASVFDPSGPIDPNNPEQVDSFAAGLATTTDSEIVLQDVAPATDGTVQATVTFRSNQAPGYGPRGREQETCSRWSVIYTLRQTTTGYLILRTRGTSTPC